MTRPEVQSWFDPPTGTVTHCIRDPASRACAVVDPVLDFDYPSGRTSHTSAEAVARWIEARGLAVVWLLETHAHADHLSAAPWLRERLGGSIAIGNRISDVQRAFADMLELSDVSRTGDEFDRLFADGDAFSIGELDGTVWHTPGHTPACVSYVFEGAAFIGDTLFAPDFGSARCDFPGGDAGTLYRSVQRIYRLPADTRLYLCHDYPPADRPPMTSVSVAEQRRANVHLRDGIAEAEFVDMRRARDRTLGMPQLLWPSIQVNIRAGRLPEPSRTGRRYLKVPLDAF